MDLIVLRGGTLKRFVTVFMLVGCLAASISLPVGSAHTQSTDRDVFVYLPLIIGQGAPTPPPSSNVVVNGDFEGGRTGWVEYEDSTFYDYELIVHASGLPGLITPYDGDWAVWLGGDSELTTYIEQEITVPATGPELVYWHWIDSIFACDGSSGGVLLNGTFVDQYPLCATADTGGWMRQSVDLTAYAGQTVQLCFASQTEMDNYSSLYIDTVSVRGAP